MRLKKHYFFGLKKNIKKIKNKKNLNLSVIAKSYSIYS